MRTISQQAGDSNPLLAMQLVSVNIIVGPPFSVLKRPTMRPTQAHTQAVSLDEQTPFDLKGKVPADYIEKKANKYLYSYMLMFIGVSAILCVSRLLYLLHLYLNKPYTLLASAAGSTFYDPNEAPLKAVTQRQVLFVYLLSFVLLSHFPHTHTHINI
jgi:hypothetical protein